MATKEETRKNLEEEALKRKERLKNLKRKFEEHKITDEDKNDKNEISKPIFRNYRKDDDDDTNIVDSIKITEITELPEVKEQLNEMKSPLEISEIEVSNLAPRKVDFDLKRSIAKKLQKLEKRTQLSISELIRMRLKSQSEEENNLLANVNTGAQETQKANEDVDSD